MRPTLLTVFLLVVAIAGCGSSDSKPPAATPTAARTPKPVATADLSGYPEGVRKYYQGIPAEPPADPELATEAEYNRPPDPAETKIPGTITLTGVNTGVRLKVKVTGVDRVGSHIAVNLHIVNDGIAVYEGALANAAVTYADGKALPTAKHARAKCTHRTEPVMRLDVSRQADGCLLFPAKGDEKPERFQLALETVPTEAGGIWNLR